MSAAKREDDPMIPEEKVRACPLCMTPMTDDHEESAPHQRAADTQKELWLTRFAVVWLAGLLVLAGLGLTRTALMIAGLAGFVVLSYLGMRWGVGDIPATRGQAIGVVVGTAVVFVLM
jgi:hypothetical protein